MNNNNNLQLKNMKITFTGYAESLTNERIEFVKQLAALTTSTEVTVYRWMSGESVPTKMKREAIAKFLGKTTAELWPSKSDDDE